MRTFLNIPCEGEALAATIDTAEGATGLLIVGGGTEIRSGAHGGMARLAAAVAAAGYPTLRYDRRGVGESGGDDPGFADSGPDIAAAVTALRARLPEGGRVIGFGLCDGATALALHHAAAGLDGLLLANPWVVEPVDDLPPPAAVRAHYARRLLDPRFWRRLLTGGVNVRKAVRGVASLGAAADTSLRGRIASALAAGGRPVAVLLATGDATAIAFDDAYRSTSFALLRSGGQARLERIDSASHTFAGADGERLATFVIRALEQTAPG